MLVVVHDKVRMIEGAGVAEEQRLPSEIPAVHGLPNPVGPGDELSPKALSDRLKATGSIPSMRFDLGNPDLELTIFNQMGLGNLCCAPEFANFWELSIR